MAEILISGICRMGKELHPSGVDYVVTGQLPCEGEQVKGLNVLCARRRDGTCGVLPGQCDGKGTRSGKATIREGKKGQPRLTLSN